jgi:hypothetical protein
VYVRLYCVFVYVSCMYIYVRTYIYTYIYDIIYIHICTSYTYICILTMYRNMCIHVLIQIDVYAYIETYKEDVIVFQDEVSRTILLYSSLFT